MHPTNKKAFTLIELLVVVLIIGILAAIALPQYEKSVMKTKFAKVITYSNIVAQAEEEYYLINGKYACRPMDLTLDIPYKTITSGTFTFEDGYTVMLNSPNCGLGVSAYGMTSTMPGSKGPALHRFFSKAVYDYPGGPSLAGMTLCWGMNVPKYENFCKSQGEEYPPGSTWYLIN